MNISKKIAFVFILIGVAFFGLNLGVIVSKTAQGREGVLINYVWMTTGLVCSLTYYIRFKNS